MFYVVSTNLTIAVSRLFSLKQPNAINKTDVMISRIDHSKLLICVEPEY